VVDEADQMISQQGFSESTINLKRSINPRAQILLFSATFPDRVVKFADAVAPKAIHIRVKTEEFSLATLPPFYMVANNEAHKLEILTNIFAFLTIGQCIIFVHTVKTAKWLTEKIRAAGLTVGLLHGKDMPHEERDRVMADFRSSAVTILISTNVLARGIDVLEVNVVIHYDLPLTRDNTPDFETYIHRIGRSGRFGKSGAAINFIHNELTKRQLEAIQNNFKKTIDQLPTDAAQIESVGKQLREALAKKPTVPLAATVTSSAVPGGPPVKRTN